MALTFNDNPPKKILYNDQDVLTIKYNNDIVWEKSPPAEYRQVEYLQSSGSQYIDLGRTPNNDDIIQQKFMSLNTTNSICSWYGSMPASNAVRPRLSMGVYSSGFFIGVNNTSTLKSLDNEVHVVKWQQNTESTIYMDVDGTETTRTSTGGYDPAIVLTSYLFARHGNNGVQVYDNAGTRIYYHREYLADGTIAMSLVPCYRIADNKPGMYDLVSDTFLINQGSGEFTYPS